MKNQPVRHTDGVINEGLHVQASGISSDLLTQLAYNEKMAELGKISAGIVHELNARSRL